jgi:hypothetical protein
MAVDSFMKRNNWSAIFPRNSIPDHHRSPAIFYGLKRQSVLNDSFGCLQT